MRRRATFKGRVHYAAAWLREHLDLGHDLSRVCADCFEEGDGDAVHRALLELAAGDADLRCSIAAHFPDWLGDIPTPDPELFEMEEQ